MQPINIKNSKHYNNGDNMKSSFELCRINCTTHVRNGRNSSELNNIYRCACFSVIPPILISVTAPLDSSGFLGGLLWIVGVFSKYREQNVNISSNMYPSAIEPSGAALLRTLILYRCRHLHVWKHLLKIHNHPKITK